MQLQPYLFFDGRCEEAIDYYGRTLGAKVEMLMRFKDCPEPAQAQQVPAETREKIMHATLRIGDTQFMASDGHCLGKPTFQGFALSLAAADEAEADKIFGVLSDGGQVQMPIGKTFFSPRFGMVADKFGVSWMVIVAPKA